MHIVTQDEKKQRRGFDFPEDVDLVRVGSTTDCEVYLPDVRIAEEHFQLRRLEGSSWILEHCEIPADGPAQFTRLYVNALEVPTGTEVHHHDEIAISRFLLTLFLDNSSANAPRSAIVEEASKIREHPLPPGAEVRKDLFAEVTLPPRMVARLADLAFDINRYADLSTLMSATIRAVQEMFNPHQVWMGTRRHAYGRMEFVETRMDDGSTGGEPHLIDTFVFRCTERGQLVLCSSLESFPVETMMCIPLLADRGILGMIYLDRKEDSVPFGETDLDCLSAMGVVVARQLDRIVADQVELHEAIKAGQLSFVRELQAVMDPTNVPQWEGLQMAMYCKPGLDASGDIFDVMRLPNGLASYVCGHIGAAPTTTALAMAQVRAAFRMGGLHADPPHVLLRALNWILHNEQNPCALSGVGLVMNPKTGAMQFSTAGDAGAVVVGAGGQVRSLVHESAPEAGSLAEYAYTGGAGRFGDGETMILFTPGCYTVCDENDQPLGKTHFLEAAADLYGQPASTALDELLSDFHPYFNGDRQNDDITIMVLHRE
ncbi:MAG: SpoIIE family protein phosphatase [Planctomycetes bacterium]|nr:SpoIIE family protein phosphatase [Planctomycetota bacterium]